MWDPRLRVYEGLCSTLCLDSCVPSISQTEMLWSHPTNNKATPSYFACHVGTWPHCFTNLKNQNMSLPPLISLPKIHLPPLHLFPPSTTISCPPSPCEKTLATTNNHNHGHLITSTLPPLSSTTSGQPPPTSHNHLITCHQHKPLPHHSNITTFHQNCQES